jgi:hypothetical protein
VRLNYLIIPDIDLDLTLTPEKYASKLKAALEKVLKIKQVNRDVRMEKNKIMTGVQEQQNINRKTTLWYRMKPRNRELRSSYEKYGRVLTALLKLEFRRKQLKSNQLFK